MRCVIFFEIIHAIKAAPRQELPRFHPHCCILCGATGPARKAVALAQFRTFVQSFCNEVFPHPDALRSLGINHVILNLEYGARDAGKMLGVPGTQIPLMPNATVPP